MMIVGRQEGFADPETLVQKLNDVVANNEAFVVAARADRAERDMNQAIREEQDAAFQETLRQVRDKQSLSFSKYKPMKTAIFATSWSRILKNVT